jgi:hypothetical protein
MPTIKKNRPAKKAVRRTKKAPRAKAKGVLGRIAPVSLEDIGLKVCNYGRSATGKTTLVSSFPKPILHIVCSAIGLGESRSIANTKGIDDVELEKSEDLRELVEHVRDSGKYQTVCLDHATGMQDLMLREILELTELPAQGSWGMASREQWGQCALKTKECLRAILGLSCNVVINAQEREFDNDGEGEVLMPYVAAALSPSVVGWLNPACDYIVNSFIRGKVKTVKKRIGKKVVEIQTPMKGAEYCLRVGPHPVYTTKFRVPKGTELPEVIVDPDYSKIMKLIQGG